MSHISEIRSIKFRQNSFLFPVQISANYFQRESFKENTDISISGSWKLRFPEITSKALLKLVQGYLEPHRDI